MNYRTMQKLTLKQVQKMADAVIQADLDELAKQSQRGNSS